MVVIFGASSKFSSRASLNGNAVKQESDPITPDEWLIRRVHLDQFRTGKDPYVSPKAFRPRVNGDQPDTDGISLFRLTCLRDEHDILEMIADEPNSFRISG